MSVFSVDFTQSIFAATLQRPAQLERLANEALKSGIDRYIAKDYEGAVKEFKRAIGLGANSEYAPSRPTKQRSG